MTLFGLIDKFLNRKIRFYSEQFNSYLIMGDMGAGKSSLMSFLNQYYISLGYKTLSNYPMEDSFQIPLVNRTNKDGSISRIINKQWLYNSNLKGCVIFLDEAADLYPARAYATGWTASDTDFFTKLRKNHIILIMATQYYDLIDLNCKRSTQCTLFLSQHRWFRNTSNVRVSRSVTAPIASRESYILSKDYQNANESHYGICELFYGNVKLWRKPYYQYFITDFDFSVKNEVSWDGFPTWNSLIERDNETVKTSERSVS